jgi:hypothetical protein
MTQLLILMPLTLFQNLMEKSSGILLSGKVLISVEHLMENIYQMASSILILLIERKRKKKYFILNIDFV